MHSRAFVLGTALVVTLGCIVTGQPRHEQSREDLQRADREDTDGELRRLTAFGVLDMDADGDLSAREIDAAPTSLASLDSDGDGRLSVDELSARRRGVVPGRAPTVVGQIPAGIPVIRLGADGDSEVEIEDLPPQFQSRLSAIDTDGDGRASAAEILAVAMAQAGGSDAQGPGDAQPRVMPGVGSDGASPQVRSLLMAVLDADQDGAVSETEIASATQSLRQLDRDGDGRVSAGELRP